MSDEKNNTDTVRALGELVGAAGLMLSEIDTCGHPVDPAYRATLHDAWTNGQASLASAPPSAPVGVDGRDREADRQRFSDPAFNEWLDMGISDCGHTVWDAVGDTQAAWAGWEARKFTPFPEVDGLPINDAVPAPTQIQPGNQFLWNWAAMQQYGRACIAHALAQQPAAKTHVECRECRACGHMGINDSAAWKAACHECGWFGAEPAADRCPECDRTDCMGAACPKCGDLYLLAASTDVPTQQPAAPSGILDDYARANLAPLHAENERLRAEVEGLRRELDDAAVALIAACQGLAEFEGFERAQHEAFNRAEAACRKAIDGIKGDSNG